MEWMPHATFDLEVSIYTVFLMLIVEAMAGEIERGIYDDVEAVSDHEAGWLAEPHPVAGA